MKENNPAPWREQEFGDARGTWTVGDLYDHALEHHELRPIPVAALEENNLDSDEQLGIRHLQGWILDWEEILDVPHGPPHGDSAAARY